MRNSQNRVYLKVTSATPHKEVVATVKEAFLSGKGGRYHAMCTVKQVPLSAKMDKAIANGEVLRELPPYASNVHIVKTTEYNTVRYGINRDAMRACKKANEIERDFHLTAEDSEEKISPYIQVIPGVLKKHGDNNKYYICYTAGKNSKPSSKYELVGDTPNGEVRKEISFERALELSTKSNLGIHKPKASIASLEAEVRGFDTENLSEEQIKTVRALCSQLRDSYRIANLSEVTWVTK